MNKATQLSRSDWVNCVKDSPKESITYISFDLAQTVRNTRKVHASYQENS